jgi:hypothetical protein
MSAEATLDRLWEVKEQVRNTDLSDFEKARAYDRMWAILSTYTPARLTAVR